MSKKPNFGEVTIRIYRVSQDTFPPLGAENIKLLKTIVKVGDFRPGCGIYTHTCICNANVI